MMEGYIIPFILERQKERGRDARPCGFSFFFFFFFPEVDGIFLVCYGALRIHAHFSSYFSILLSCHPFFKAMHGVSILRKLPLEVLVSPI